MSQMSHTIDMVHTNSYGDTARVLRRTIIIGLIAFLTVVDLFATQAILPSLAQAYRVTPAAMSFAVNASTMGMAVAGLFVAFFSRRIDRRLGILISLCVLAIPTALLAVAPDLTTFTILRVTQGLCMASAFTLMLAYLGEECSATDAGGAFAAYITGNVASNLIGRLISAGVADHFGLAANFYFFSALNLAGAVLVYFTIRTTMPILPAGEALSTPLAVWSKHLRNPPLLASFGIGFCILFAFIGTFTYVNFVLVREPLSARAYGTWLCLFRISAIDRYYAFCRRSRTAIRHATYLLECLSAGRPWAAPLAAAKPFSRDRRSNARRCRHILRAGGSHRFCRSRSDRRPWRQRAASILPAISLVGWLAPPYLARSSMGSDGRLVSPGSGSSLPRPRIWLFAFVSDRTKA